MRVCPDPLPRLPDGTPPDVFLQDAGFKKVADKMGGKRGAGQRPNGTTSVKTRSWDLWSSRCLKRLTEEGYDGPILRTNLDTTSPKYSKVSRPIFLIASIFGEIPYAPKKEPFIALGLASLYSSSIPSFFTSSLDIPNLSPTRPGPRNSRSAAAKSSTRLRI